MPFTNAQWRQKSGVTECSLFEMAAVVLPVLRHKTRTRDMAFLATARWMVKGEFRPFRSIAFKVCYQQ